MMRNASQRLIHLSQWKAVTPGTRLASKTVGRTALVGTSGVALLAGAENRPRNRQQKRELCPRRPRGRCYHRYFVTVQNINILYAPDIYSLYMSSHLDVDE